MRSPMLRNLPPSSQRYVEFKVGVRLLAEYDLNYMQDRVRADVFVGGMRAGAYAVQVIQPGASAHEVYHVLEVDGERLAEMAIQEWLQAPAEQAAKLQQQLDDFKVQYAIDQRPIWRKVYEWILGISR